MRSDPLYAFDFGMTQSMLAMADPRPRLLTPAPIPTRLTLHNDTLILSQKGGLAGFKRALGSDKPFTLHGKRFTSDALIHAYFERVREAYSIPHGSRVVLAVPSTFTFAQREALRSLAEKAGWRVVGVREEPLAAAVHAKAVLKLRHGSILVVDSGGGTTDASLVEIDASRVRVTLSKGLNLGGRDADTLLLQHFKLEDGESVRDEVRVLREALSVKEEACRRIQGEEYCLSRQELERLFQAHFQPRLEAFFTRFFEEAVLKPWEIDMLILTGGFSLTPWFQAFLESFTNTPAERIDPFASVALGLVEGMIHPPEERIRVPIRAGLPAVTLIPADSRIPAHGEAVFTTRADHLERAFLPLFAGEEFVGMIQLPLLPAPAGNVQVKLSITLTEHGLLDARVTDLATGKTLATRLKPRGKHVSLPTPREEDAWLDGVKERLLKSAPGGTRKASDE